MRIKFRSVRLSSKTRKIKEVWSGNKELSKLKFVWSLVPVATCINRFSSTKPVVFLKC